MKRQVMVTAFYTVKDADELEKLFEALAVEIPGDEVDSILSQLRSGNTATWVTQNDLDGFLIKGTMSAVVQGELH